MLISIAPLDAARFSQRDNRHLTNALDFRSEPAKLAGRE